MSKNFSANALASPFDRLAARVVDSIIFLPLMSLALAFFKQRLVMAQWLSGDAEFSFWATLYTGLGLLCFLLYQVFFISFLSATPGQFFLGLRVVDIWSLRIPHWQRALLRSCVWYFDVVVVFPLFALFSDVKRRPWHDRLADTVVVTMARRSKGGPHWVEAALVRGLSSSVIVFALLLAGLQVHFNLQDVEVREWLAQLGREQGDFCPDVTKARKTGEEAVSGPRLELALALFVVEEIDQECLKHEAQRVLWRGRRTKPSEKALAYTAMAFAHADEYQLSNDYLKKSCAVAAQSEACVVAELIRDWNEQRAEAADTRLRAHVERASFYFKLLAIRQLSHQGSSARALAVLDSLPAAAEFTSFITEHRVKALWDLGKHQQAELVFSTHWQRGLAEQNLDLLGWLCRQELRSSCYNGRACEALHKSVAQWPELLQHTPLAVAQLRRQQCGQTIELDKESLSAEASAWLQEIESVSSPAEYLVLLRQQLSRSQKIDPLIVETFYRTLAKATNEQLEQAAVVWQERSEEGSDWEEGAADLYQRALSLQNFTLAAEVVELVKKVKPLSQVWDKNQVRVLYLQGKVAEATEQGRKLLKHEKRAPAQARDGFNKWWDALSEE